jgi:hypothetical protein
VPQPAVVGDDEDVEVPVDVGGTGGVHGHRLGFGLAAAPGPAGPAGVDHVAEERLVGKDAVLEAVVVGDTEDVHGHDASPPCAGQLPPLVLPPEPAAG